MSKQEFLARCLVDEKLESRTFASKAAALAWIKDFRLLGHSVDEGRVMPVEVAAMLGLLPIEVRS